MLEAFDNIDGIKVIGWLGFLWAVSALIRRATKDFDEDLAPSVRARLSEHLKRVAAPSADWMLSFGSLFTNVFGSRHLSWHCFRRSMLVSGVTFALLVLATGALAVDGATFGELLGQGSLAGWVLWLLALMTVGMMFNGLLDYLSLWQTRIVIRLPLPVSVKVLVDIFFTAFIVRILFSVALGLLVYTGLSLALEVENDEGGASVLSLFLLYGIQFMDFPPRFGSLAFVIFATSFSTTLWLILHLLSGGVIRLLPKAITMLNTDVTPVRSIGVVTIGLVWLTGLGSGVFIFAYSWVSTS